jgi:pyruvate dehydrogenase E2 component (dihydrolipoamide acetyltransferase)
MATTIKMPQLGESVTEGTIERWLVKEGDTVEQYDPLFEVVTDKVNAEVPAEVAGKITKIMVADGETVKVGTPLAEIETNGAAAAEAPAEAAPAADEPAAEAPAAEPEPAAAGDAESAPVATTEPHSPPTPAPTDEPEPAAATATREEAPAEPAAAGSPPSPASDGSVRMTPAVRRLVREHDVDIAQLRGSGAGGRVTRDDVLAFIEKGAAAEATKEQPAAAAEPPAPAAADTASEAPAAPAAEPASPPAPAPAYRPPPQMAAPSGGDVEVPMSQMRKGIARKMTQVKQTVPHAYTVVEVDMTNVVRWREANNEAFRAREGAPLS